MILSKEEKAAHRAAFRDMSPSQKLDHIFTYYKGPILLGLVALLILVWAVHRQLTQKQSVLSLAFANVAAGEDLEHDLTGGFLRFIEADPEKQEVFLLKDLYLSNNADEMNHEYAYASRMKLMGAVNAKSLDLILMNQEAYDLLSAAGYLLELSPALFADNPSLYEQLLPNLASNAVILSDNGIEYQLGEAESHEVETRTESNAVEVLGMPLFDRAGFSDAVYLGVIANSQRFPACLTYMGYLLSE